MDTTKLTREEALRRWNASKENKRKMVEKLENLVRKSCLERTGKEGRGDFRKNLFPLRIFVQITLIIMCFMMCARKQIA